MTREEAIAFFKDMNECTYGNLEAVEMAIKALEQEPKTGRWTHDGSHWKNRFICSECGYKLFEEQTNYCPNCGARMIVPQERSGKCSKCKYHINPNYTRCKECGAERSKND